eukprot:scpid56561/ scgid35660/ RING finger protein 32
MRKQQRQPVRKAGKGADELLPGLVVRDAKTSPAVWTAVALQQARLKDLDMSFPQSFSLPPVHGQASKAKHAGAGKSLRNSTRSCGNKKALDPKANSKQERVLGPKQKPLTLAQKLGLEEQPSPCLSEGEWKQVKQKSSVRGDSEAPCPVCHDVFTAEKQQVILSCSHTFHLACLEAFEKFTAKTRGGERTASSGHHGCPLCRRRDYEKRLIFDGERSHLWKSACLIQAAWRSYAVRKWYTKMLYSMPMPTDKTLQRRYVERKIHQVSDSVVKAEAKQTAEVDKLLEEVDDALALSRQITNEATLFLESRAEPDDLPRQEHYGGKCDKIDWDSVSRQAKTRYGLDGTCAVCVRLLTSPAECSAGRVPAARSHTVALLSCAHVFHTACILAVENYSCTSVLRCPLCRCSYVRTQWTPSRAIDSP